jgi:hypothetical protein
MHQVSVVHSSDHRTMYNHIENLVGSVCRPFTPGDAPWSIYTRWNYLRTQLGGILFFVEWINPFQPNRLQNCTHQFSTKELQKSDVEFRKALRAAEKTLEGGKLDFMNLYDMNEGLCY